MFEIKVEYHSGIPVYKQIITAFTKAIEQGDFATGDKLPSVRQLSSQLNINPNTTAKVYRELELKGLVASKPGSGSFVKAQSLPKPSKSDTRLEKGKALKSEKDATLLSLWSELAIKAKQAKINEDELFQFIEGRMRNG